MWLRKRREIGTSLKKLDARTNKEGPLEAGLRGRKFTANARMAKEPFPATQSSLAVEISQVKKHTKQRYAKPCLISGIATRGKLLWKYLPLLGRS